MRRGVVGRKRPVADGAGHANDDALGTGCVGDVEAVVVGRFLLVEGGKGAEQEAVNVGQHGGAAWGDAALLEGEGEIPEKSVDVRGGFFLWKVGGEQGREVGGVVALAFLGKTGVTGAEGRVVGGESSAALAAFGGVMLAASV